MKKSQKKDLNVNKQIKLIVLTLIASATLSGCHLEKSNTTTPEAKELKATSVDSITSQIESEESITIDSEESTTTESEESITIVPEDKLAFNMLNAFVLSVVVDGNTKTFEIKNEATNGSEYDLYCGNKQVKTTTHSSACYFKKGGKYTIKLVDKSNNKNAFSELKFTQGTVVDVLQWGDERWTSMKEMFAKQNKLESFSSLNPPNLESVTNMYKMFSYASKFNADLSKWDVSRVNNMQSMFSHTSKFNANLNKWNVSNVKNMRSMFYMASAFNGNLSKWDVSNVKTMRTMFVRAFAFNQDIGQWKVKNVTTMEGMFNAATLFNKDISKWNVSSVTNMHKMFAVAAAFDQDISKWNVSKVENMRLMFHYSSINRDLSSWKVENVTNFVNAFSNAKLADKKKPKFNQ